MATDPSMGRSGVSSEASTLSTEAMEFLRERVAEAIAYRKQWWNSDHRMSHHKMWDELYEAGLMRSDMYGVVGLTPEAVRLVTG